MNDIKHQRRDDQRAASSAPVQAAPAAPEQVKAEPADALKTLEHQGLFVNQSIVTPVESAST